MTMTSHEFSPLVQVILMPSFFSRGRHQSSADAQFVLRNLILPRTSKPDGHSRDLSHAVCTYDMAAVDLLHPQNPPTSAGVEPATLSAEGQRQTNSWLEMYANLQSSKTPKSISDKVPYRFVTPFSLNTRPLQKVTSVKESESSVLTPLTCTFLCE
ncbi:hypothetical protein TNCV_1017741 [Trichonephila clavipes]|uniref:Uncharacterized protein n=1 Tax=Trichonephila clavipes TaxID=2585209 RepID=A0A8X6VY55_TRICX|nr:hypothetical protein TNCV_1017741 [Trichonephila clavipes]